MKTIKTISFLFALISLNGILLSQNPEGFDDMAIKMADKYVPIITLTKVDEVEKTGMAIVYLDAREFDEYQVSHIKNAIHVGYDKLKEDEIKKMDKEAIYIVYCSVGYRSGKVAKKMKDFGFKNVFNLYGGIFNWANNGKPMIKGDSKTKRVHPYNKKWGKWLNEDLWEGI